MFSVLLVDDEPLVRTVIRDKIKWNELGFEFAGDCENGKQAVEFIEHRPVDLVITDINMPYMDGMELSRYLYTRYPDTAIVIFSGFSEFEYAQKAIQYKVVEYILKPVTASELTEVLVKVHKRLEESESNARKMNELTEVYQNYRKNQTAITSRLLGDLMLDSGDNSSTLNELKEAGIIFNYQAYCVACIRVDSWNDPNRIRTGESQDDSLYSFAIENICSEILKNEEKGLAFQSRDRYILLLLYTKKAADFRKEAVRLCHLCQDTISNVMHLGTSFGIGKSVRTVRDFGISYRNAMESMDYHYVLGEGYFLDMETDAGDLDQDVDLGDYLSKLTVAIKSCSHGCDRVPPQILRYSSQKLCKDGGNRSGKIQELCFCQESRFQPDRSDRRSDPDVCHLLCGNQGISRKLPSDGNTELCLFPWLPVTGRYVCYCDRRH